MKKTLFFAIALVAGVLAFTSCNKKDKNEPSNPDEITTDVNPEDYINTMWRIDSCKAGNEKQRPPHGLIRVFKNNTASFDADTSAYEFKDGKLIFFDEEFTIAGVKKGWAHLQARGTDLYLSQLPELDIESQILEPKASDFVGTWKHAYYATSYHAPDNSDYMAGSNPWVETWEFKEDGTCIYTDVFTGMTKTGTWSWEYGLDFLNNPLAYLFIDENDRITVQPLTKNWFQIPRGYRVGGGATEYKYYWFYRVK